MYNNFYMPTGDFETYVVKTGDSLWEISKKYQTTIEDLMRLNNLTGEMIYPNQILFVPKKENDGCYYQTKEGDTLGDVFKKLKLDKKCLKKYEPLFDILIEPNQMIELVNQHKVMYKGESIEEFLADNNLTSADLVKLNRWLKPGEEVIVG